MLHCNFYCEGKKWQRRRKMLTPAFHFKILDDFMVVFNENANILRSILENEFLNEKKPKDIFPYITRCALDIICGSSFISFYTNEISSIFLSSFAYFRDGYGQEN